MVTKEKMMIRYLLAAIFVASIGTALAASGGSPNGKPFVEINGQLQEIRAVQLSTEARLDALFERIGSLEAAVDSIDQSILLLAQQNSEISNLLSYLESEVMSVEDVAAKIVENIETLTQSINSQQGDISALESQLGDYENLLSIMQLDTDGVIEQLSLRIENNEDMLRILEMELTNVVDAVKLKQDIISGICPEGEAVYAVGADGSLSCIKTGSSDFAYVTVLKMSGTSYSFNRYINVDCPENTTIISGGFKVNYIYSRSAEEFTISASQMDGNGWKVRLSQYFKAADSFIAEAYCRLN